MKRFWRCFDRYRKPVISLAVLGDERASWRPSFYRYALGGCVVYREGKGDHRLYIREVEDKRRVVPIDMRAREMSPAYVLRIFRQFGFTDEEIESLLQQ